MRWRLLSYAGGTSINGEGFGTFLTQEAIDDVNRGNNDTPSLFYGCYAIANKLYQAGGIDERFDTSLDTLNGIYKLMDAAHSTNGNFAAGKNDTDLVNAMKELLSGYYVSLKKKYDSPPAERIVTDGVESFYTIGITECANPKYKANICSDIRTLFPEIKNPEEIFAPDVSPVSILSLIFISFIYIFIYAVYWVFSVWTQFALIVLPILGMLLLIRPKYLTGSFQFMLGPYFLKMIISLITAILVSIVGIEGIVDAGFEALFVLVLLCGLTVLAVPEVMGFVNQILGGIQQYISSEQSGYSPDSAIAAALSASKNAMSK